MTSGIWDTTPGDVNGDGNVDLLAAIEYGKVDVLLGNGDGTFSRIGSIDTDAHTHAVALGDLTGDLTPDLAVASSVGLSVFAAVADHGARVSM